MQILGKTIALCKRRGAFAILSRRRFILSHENEKIFSYERTGVGLSESHLEWKKVSAERNLIKKKNRNSRVVLFIGFHSTVLIDQDRCYDRCGLRRFLNYEGLYLRN